MVVLSVAMTSSPVSWCKHVCFMSVYFFVLVLLDVVFQLIKAD